MFQSTHPHGVRRAEKLAKTRWIQFQSTHPHGVRLVVMIIAGFKMIGFNPRTRTGCDRRIILDASTPGVFQSTHPHGVRHGSLPVMIARLEFQSTHPHGVRHASAFYFVIHGRCFNPRTRTGCDTFCVFALLGRYVFQSTHPHGVRLLAGRLLGTAADVSIHAPARGATRSEEPIQNQDDRFQSTHPHGVRPTQFRGLIPRLPVSIHAPARGATFNAARNSSSSIGFNPRTRTGCDTASDFLIRLLLVFQSTHPHGVRPLTGRSDPASF